MDENKAYYHKENKASQCYIQSMKKMKRNNNRGKPSQFV